jgi:hypothetical protein
MGDRRIAVSVEKSCSQCIQIPCPSAAVALVGKGKVTLTVGKGREEL